MTNGGKSLGRNASVMAAGTFVSRILGMVRTILLGAAIGVTGSIAADAFAVANKLPNIFFAIIAAGVLNAVLVPQIVRAFHQGRARTVHRILTLGGFWFLVGTAILTAAAQLFVLLFTENWGPEQVTLGVAFAWWCIPQLFFYGMYTLLGGVLNSREQFGAFMWAPAANNVVAILGLGAYLVIFGPYAVGQNDDLLTVWTPGRIALIAGVATLGIAVQAGVLIPALRRGGYRWRWTWTGPKGELAGVRRMVGWALGAVLVEQVAVTWTTRIASAAHEASGGDPTVAGVAAWDYALMIYLVPHSLVAVSIVTALFTRMARAAAAKDLATVRAELSRGWRNIGVFAAFAAVVLAVLADHIIRVLAPTLSPDAVASVAFVLRVLSLALMPLGASVLVKRTYFALEDSRSVFFIHIPMAIAWVSVALTVQALAAPKFWVAGVALGLAASDTVAVLARAWGLRRRLGGLDGRRVVGTYAKAIFSALVSGGIGLLLVYLLPDSANTGGTAAIITSGGVLALVGSVMAVTYIAFLRALRVPEVTAILGVLKKFSRQR